LFMSNFSATVTRCSYIKKIAALLHGFIDLHWFIILCSHATYQKIDLFIKDS